MSDTTSSDKTWEHETVMCGGEGEYKHRPSPMIFERKGLGIHNGAFFRCTVCDGRKFVWRTLIMGNIKWEWDESPGR